MCNRLSNQVYFVEVVGFDDKLVRRSGQSIVYVWS